MSLSVAFAVAAFADPAPAAVGRADRLILLDVARAGARLVAVGERGAVFSSDDGGKTWQGQRTAVTRTLTAVAFADGRLGVAVGHGGSLLRSEDGGATWRSVKVEEAGMDSLLGVTALGPRHFVAYGAFGLYLESADGGASWVRRNILAEDFDRHISAVFRVDGKLMLVGESATVAISNDGRAWQAIATPYAGSYFGGIATREGAALIFGMRGNLYRSSDLGKHWTRIDLGVEQSIASAAVLADGRIVLVGNAGLVMFSRDDGRTFAKADGGTAANLAQVVVASEGRLLAVGDRGVVEIPTTPADK